MAVNPFVVGSQAGPRESVQHLPFRHCKLNRMRPECVAVQSRTCEMHY